MLIIFVFRPFPVDCFHIHHESISCDAWMRKRTVSRSVCMISYLISVKLKRNDALEPLTIAFLIWKKPFYELFLKGYLGRFEISPGIVHRRLCPGADLTARSPVGSPAVPAPEISHHDTERGHGGADQHGALEGGHETIFQRRCVDLQVAPTVELAEGAVENQAG